MIDSAQVYINDNKICLTGILDFSNAMTIYKASMPVFACSQSDVIIDFSGLMSGNSVILAMLVNWIRLAQKSGKKVRLESLSTEVKSLISASRLSSLIDAHVTTKI